MDPLMLQAMNMGGYNPTGVATASGVNSLPQITSTNDMLMFPFLQNYKAQLDSYDVTGNVNNIVPTSPSMPVMDTYKMYEQIQENMMDFNLHQQERYRYNSAEVTAPMNKLTIAAQSLQAKVVGNEQDQIQGALAAFVQSYKQAYDPEGKMDDETALANAVAEYQKITGESLIASIKNNGNSSFMSGFIKAATFGLFGNRTTADENIAQIEKQPVSENSRKWNVAGKVTGRAATGLIAGAVIGFCIGGPAGSAIGAKIGTTIGGLWGYFS